MATSIGNLEQLSINTIRTLSMDAVQKANSGHPGTPMALAPIAYVLWNEVLRYDPANPLWPGRDRFVLSCGHASMLLYSLLHLTGVSQLDAQGQPTGEPSISLDDIRNFRQWGSPCAGHPEFGHAAGIETTTGPLGQGIANSVGMAMAAKWLAARYDRAQGDLFGYRVFALCSDGDLMEGLGNEAASLAGHLGLGNLCWIYDDNRITIEGNTDLAFSEDVARRFAGLGWHTIHLGDANDLDQLREAFAAQQQVADRPTLLIVRSVIGFGSPNKADSHDAHGAPLGAAEVKLTKQAYGWPTDGDFLAPAEVKEHFAQGIGARGARDFAQWQELMSCYGVLHPTEAAELSLIWQGKLPADWEQGIPTFSHLEKPTASRNSSGKILNSLARQIPWFLGGSADLAPSNKTMLSGETDFSRDNYAGRNLHFGIREHAMAAICNGLSLSGLRPYCGTFFVFTDYMRPSMRLSSLMRQGVIYVLTHDSIGLGEDGPTHQPVEHLAACRAIPGLRVYRPADANEASECYRSALADSRHPSVMVLTRQDLPTLDRSRFAPASNALRGGYVLSEAAGGKPQVLLLGSGSEVPICLEAQTLLERDGVAARVVSMPCWELFDLQDEAYRLSVLPREIAARVGVEAGIRQGWDRYLGAEGKFVGMTSFGASAPFEELYARFGITAANVAAQAKALLSV